MKKSIIRNISLGYIALTALFLGYLGTKWAFFPLAHMEKLGVTASGIPAINTLKSIMGTALLGTTAACILFMFDRLKWYRTILLLIGVMLPVRIVSLVVDGFHLRMGIYAFLEAIIIVAVLVAVKLENPDEGTTGELVSPIP